MTNPPSGGDPHARPRGHAGVGVEDVDLERLAGAGRLHLPGIERPERQRGGHVAAVHAPVDRGLVGGKLREGADDAAPVPLRLQPGEEHLVAGRHDPSQSGDLLVAGARAFQRQSHQVAQQFLAQSPARAAPSAPRSPARSTCRRARGAREIRRIPAQQRRRIERSCLHGQDPDCSGGSATALLGVKSIAQGGHRWSDARHAHIRSDHRRAVPQRHRRTGRRDGADDLPHRLFGGAEEHHGLQRRAVRRAGAAGRTGPRAAGPSLLDPGRAPGGAAAFRRRHRRGRHPDQQRPV